MEVSGVGLVDGMSGSRLPDMTVSAGMIRRKAVGEKSRLCLRASAVASGLVPRYPLQKPPSRGLEGSGGEGGGDEGLKVEGGFTFGRLQAPLKPP